MIRKKIIFFSMLILLTACASGTKVSYFSFDGPSQDETTNNNKIKEGEFFIVKLINKTDDKISYFCLDVKSLVGTNNIGMPKDKEEIIKVKPNSDFKIKYKKNNIEVEEIIKIETNRKLEVTNEGIKQDKLNKDEFPLFF
jgi:hypothetical protein